jgi:hypothetical protein
VFGNRLPRRITGTKREEVIGGLRRLHNEELHNLYASRMLLLLEYEVKDDKMGGEGSRCGKDEKYIRHFGRNARREETIVKT